MCAKTHIINVFLECLIIYRHPVKSKQRHWEASQRYRDRQKACQVAAISVRANARRATLPAAAGSATGVEVASVPPVAGVLTRQHPGPCSHCCHACGDTSLHHNCPASDTAMAARLMSCCTVFAKRMGVPWHTVSITKLLSISINKFITLIIVY